MDKFLEDVVVKYHYFTKVPPDSITFFTEDGLILMEITPEPRSKDTYEVLGYFGRDDVGSTIRNPSYINCTKYRQSPEDVIKLIDTYCPVYQNYLEQHAHFDHDKEMLIGMGFTENVLYNTMSRFDIQDENVHITILPPFIDPDYYLYDGYILEIVDKKKHMCVYRTYYDTLEGVLNQLNTESKTS